MSDTFGRKAGTLAAASMIAAAGVVGAPAGQAAPPAPVGAAEVASVANPTFEESLQALLNDIGAGDVDSALAWLGVDAHNNPLADADTKVVDLLNSLDPNVMTFGEQIESFLHIPVGIPLYSSNPATESLLGSASFHIGNQTFDSPFLFDAPPSFFAGGHGDPAGWLYDDSINGTPFGNVELGKLLDLVLGGAGEGNHSLTDLITNIGLGDFMNSQVPTIGGLPDWLTGVSTYWDAIDKLGGLLDNYNYVICDFGGLVSEVCPRPIGDEFGHLTRNNSLYDWLSGLLQTSTRDVTHHSTNVAVPDHIHAGTATTLGQYLHSILVNEDTTQHLGEASIGDLMNTAGMSPNDTWITMLAQQSFGGTLLHPDPALLGDQTIAAWLDSMLPETQAVLPDGVDGDTLLVDYLEALGLLPL